MEDLTKEELERIRIIVERERGKKKPVVKVEKENVLPETKPSYYERHKEERRAYQREYMRKKYGYGEFKPSPYKTEEERRNHKNEVSKAYYQRNKDKRKAYNKQYYAEHRQYFIEKSREHYMKICREREKENDEL